MNRLVDRGIVARELAGKKIVVLIGAFGRGGCERQAFLLVRDLRERHGIDAEVWALKYDGSYRQEFEAAGIPTKVLDFRAPTSPCICCGQVTPRWLRGVKWGRRLLRVARQLRQGRIDILLPFTTWPNLVAGLTYRIAGVQVCIWGERHCGAERVPTPERFAVKQFRQFIANSTAGVEFLVREMGVAPERIIFLPNGVEQPEPDPRNDWRERLALKPGQLLVVKVANLTNNKDHATLIRAWKIVQDTWLQEPKPLLALAGATGEAFESCQRIVRENGLDSAVRFLGSIPDVPALVQACDLAAFSSPHEGMPNGVMECMAAGKAMIASDLPGIRDVLGPDGTHLLFPVGDARRCAELILKLLHDVPGRTAVGEANRNRIRSEFSVERMVDRYLDIIRGNISAAPVSTLAISGLALSPAPEDP